MKRSAVAFLLTLVCLAAGATDLLAISYEPEVATPGQSITFRYHGATTSCIGWSFGDGTTRDGGARISHTFRSAGTFTIKAWDLECDYGPATPPTKTTSIVIDPAADSGPTIRKSRKRLKKGTVSIQPGKLHEGEKATLTARGFKSDCINWVVNGDRLKPTSISVSYRFKKPGRYEVKMYADCGKKLSGSKTVVIAKVDRFVNASKATVSVGDEVLFQTRGFLSNCVKWDFKDGTKKISKKRINYRFKRPGTYMVAAYDHCGSGGIKPQTVRVKVLDNELKIRKIDINFKTGSRKQSFDLNEKLPAQAVVYYKNRGLLTYQWLLDKKPVGPIQRKQLMNGGRIALKAPEKLLTKSAGFHRLSIKLINFNQQLKVPSVSYQVIKFAAELPEIKKPILVGKPQKPDFGPFKLHFFETVMPVVKYEQRSGKNPAVDVYLSAQGANEVTLSVPGTTTASTSSGKQKVSVSAKTEKKIIPSAGNINEIVRVADASSPGDKIKYIVKKEGNNWYIPIELTIKHARPGYESITIKRSIKQYVTNPNTIATSTTPLIKKFSLLEYKRPLPANYKDVGKKEPFPPKGTIYITKSERRIMERRVNFDLGVEGADTLEVIHLKSGKTVDRFNTEHTDMTSLPANTPNRPEILNAGTYQLRAQNIHGVSTATYDLIQQDGYFSGYMKTQFDTGCWKEITDDSGKKIRLPRYTGKGHYRPSPRYGEPGYGKNPVEKYDCTARIHSKDHINKFYGFQKPTIELFRPDPSQIGPEESAKLIMSVSDASHGRIQNDITIQLIETATKKTLRTHVFKRGESHSMEKGYYFKKGL